jgi:predicted AlkP superfamily pyrophosphatase or phosphodiesterase
MPAPLLLINAVGLTPRLLPHAPRLRALAETGWVRPLREVLPAVTCTAQATLLTGQTPERHGIVGNGWLYRDTAEVRFWQQSNRLIQSEPVYVTARRRAKERGREFRCAKLFWWFNQGAAVDISVTPKPYYGADGNKVFGIQTTPPILADVLQRPRSQGGIGRFPFTSFWGPGADWLSTWWIAECARKTIGDDQGRPDLTLVYLPHLDYDPQRYGPRLYWMPQHVRELDAACEPLLDEARRCGARVWVVSEYGHVSVKRPVLPNRTLREANLLSVRPGPFGEQLDTFESRAFAVCDHQLAHVYVRDESDVPRVYDLIAALPGVARVLAGEERAEIDLRHARSGEIVALSEPDAWFAYPFWLDDRQAPDYARTVDIHRKPGYDPCELFFDPKLTWPEGRAVWRLLQKKLGFRTLFDVIPLDPTIVKGSHGLRAADGADGPLLIGDGPPPSGDELLMTAVRELLLERLELA